MQPCDGSVFTHLSLILAFTNRVQPWPSVLILPKSRDFAKKRDYIKGEVCIGEGGGGGGGGGGGAEDQMIITAYAWSAGALARSAGYRLVATPRMHHDVNMNADVN